MCADQGCMTAREACAYSPLALAFLGDSVYERLVREEILRSANRPVAQLHARAVAHVCAEYQSAAYDVVLPRLTDTELAVLKRGRNATGNTVPKHADVVTYRRATALECLFGFLALCGQEARIAQLFQWIWTETKLTEKE